jgi:dTDP-4-dehydrorhamnose reductase
MLKDKSWLILGGSGQLGRTLQDHLVDQGIGYFAPTRKVLDLTSATNVVECIDFYGPSVIVNCAAWTNVDKAENYENDALLINGYAAEYIAKSARKNSSTLIHISTDYVFSGEGKKPWKEHDLLEPKTAYGRTKKFAECAILDIYPENSFIFRTAWLYSKYGNNFVKTICSKAFENNETLSIVNDQIGQPTLADDLCKQLVLSIKRKIEPGIYHGTNSGQATWYDFATEIFTLIGHDKNRITPIPSSVLQRPAPRPHFSVLGHDEWLKLGLPEMRGWRIALQGSIMNILKASVIGA